MGFGSSWRGQGVAVDDVKVAWEHVGPGATCGGNVGYSVSDHPFSVKS